ncbi:MAG TPA: nucleoside triphosphate pyrophosphohydrolase [Nocardioidaceae bacterium]|nr:nucleoside triphosphate pyrophosphohydrolase [Nocardioidaceae bacterium]
MGKLVRDRIPEVIEGRGGQAVSHVLEDDDAYRAALLDKLVEEAEEVRDAPVEALLDEAADVYEVLLALAVSQGWTSEQIARRAEEKRAERGGFAGRVWLDSWE